MGQVIFLCMFLFHFCRIGVFERKAHAKGPSLSREHKEGISLLPGLYTSVFRRTNGTPILKQKKIKGQSSPMVKIAPGGMLS